MAISGQICASRPDCCVCGVRPSGRYRSGTGLGRHPSGPRRSRGRYAPAGQLRYRCPAAPTRPRLPPDRRYAQWTSRFAPGSGEPVNAPIEPVALSKVWCRAQSSTFCSPANNALHRCADKPPATPALPTPDYRSHCPPGTHPGSMQHAHRSSSPAAAQAACSGPAAPGIAHRPSRYSGS